MTICYVRWRDACHCQDEQEISSLGELVELEECGFLLKETKSSICIGLELQDGATSARYSLTIPRVNIVEMRKTKLSRAFPKRSRNTNKQE